PVSDTTRATVTNDGMVKAASSPGEVVVTAKIRASPAISTQTIIQVKDPGAFADVRILGLGYTP
ncbi:MAG: hypothetical protein HY692_07905, partial [Cyanobacteria bacterium NC_groundwater_1444_Ag_S-0.65um_54_12]|nr:hypothetical protein [Cyanobacteria bacterium NC_groundwater_1444_Ag_S-0.65um_54_12]